MFLTSFSPSLVRRNTVWSTFLPGLHTYMIFFSATQTAVQRYSAVPSLRAAKRYSVYSDFLTSFEMTDCLERSIFVVYIKTAYQAKL